jgi:hypothetical protein
MFLVEARKSGPELETTATDSAIEPSSTHASGSGLIKINTRLRQIAGEARLPMPSGSKVSASLLSFPPKLRSSLLSLAIALMGHVPSWDRAGERWRASNGLASRDPTFVPSVKLDHEIAKGISLGAEYYSDIGKLGHIEPWNKQGNYGTIAVEMKPLVFSFGSGCGLTETSDKWAITYLLLDRSGRSLWSRGSGPPDSRLSPHLEILAGSLGARRPLTPTVRRHYSRSRPAPSGRRRHAQERTLRSASASSVTALGQ